eukprot:scaffold15423_cov46-Cyclotella_meneghiniana.AAC.2
MVKTRRKTYSDSPATTAGDGTTNLSNDITEGASIRDGANKPSSSSEMAISTRQHDFSASSWWLVDTEHNSTTRQGATPLVKRCMRVYAWDVSKARKVLAAYRQFLFLKKYYEDWDATQLSPSHLVDQMWHQHILDVENYYHDMILLCGHVIGHNPDGASDIEKKRARDEKTRKGLIEHFDGDVDGEIWVIQDKKRHEDNRTTAALNNLSSIPLNIIAENSYVTVNLSYWRGYFKPETKSYLVKISSPLNECFEDFSRYVLGRETYVDLELHGFKYKDKYYYTSKWVDGSDSPESLGFEPFETIEASFEVSKARVDVYFGQNDEHSRYTVKLDDRLSTCLTEFAQSRGHSTDGYDFTHIGANIDFQYDTPNTLGRLGFSPDGSRSYNSSLRILAVHSTDLAADKEAAGNARITIRIRDQYGEGTFFRVRRWVRMGVLFRQYCERKGRLCPTSHRFLLDGDRVSENASIYVLELQDQDQIDAVHEQCGC